MSLQHPPSVHQINIRMAQIIIMMMTDEDPDHLLRVSYSKLDGLVICFQKGCGSSHFAKMFPYHYLVQGGWPQDLTTSYFNIYTPLTADSGGWVGEAGRG